MNHLSVRSPGQPLPSCVNPQSTKVPGMVKAAGYALLAVVLFSLTVPLTKVALRYFNPDFIAASRAFFAGCAALLVIRHKGWRLPSGNEFFWLAAAGSGVAIGFPQLLNWGLTTLSAAEMAVVLAGLPLSTALFATFLMKEKHSKWFWVFSLLGAVFLLGYFYEGLTQAQWRATTLAVLLATVLFAGLGYSAGSKAAKTLGGWQTICWALVMYLPISAGLFCYSLTQELKDIQKWSNILAAEHLPHFGMALIALVYLIFISQWWGFKFWYQAMADYGAGKIAQIQLMQPFFTFAFSALILGEVLTLKHLLFAVLIGASVLATLKVKAVGE